MILAPRASVVGAVSLEQRELGATWHVGLQCPQLWKEDAKLNRGRRVGTIAHRANCFGRSAWRSGAIIVGALVCGTLYRTCINDVGNIISHDQTV